MREGETIFLRKDVCDKVDTKRGSYIEENLSENEREFLWLVRMGDLDQLKGFLQNNRGFINLDCCDYRGQRALDIAIINHDYEIVTYLLNNVNLSTTHFYCAVLRAVFENEANILEMILDKVEDPNTDHEGLKELINGGSECSKCLPQVAATNLTPTMAAATTGNIEITRMLLERGYSVAKPHSPKCQCQENCAKKWQDGETLTESISRMNAYRAIASPTYLILTSEDPILSAFQLSKELEKLSRELPEMKKEYRELSKVCSKFAASLLDQCRNTEEVQTVLVQRKGFLDPRPHKFSRLHLAVQCGQKEFLTHPSCQQVLRSMWVETVGSWYSWPFRWRAFHVIKHALLTPVVSIGFIFIPRVEVIGPLRVPLNRFIYNATSYLFFLSLLMVTLLNDRRYDVHSPVSWTEIAVGCFVLGHSWHILTNITSVGFNNYLRSWWSVFDLIMFCLFLTSELLWFSVFMVNLVSESDHHRSNRMCWYWYHPILIGEGIYAAASVMAFSRLLLWFQVNSRLGPLGTSIKHMLVDVFQFFMLFFIIMLAFATGINSIYKNYKDSSRIEDGKTIDQPEAFITLKNTFKNLFWAIFGMGEPDYAQVVVGNSSLNASSYLSREDDHIFTEGIGYTLWGFYHMVTVVVLLNMLIAMMTESYQRVQKNADMEWKFACSTLWLSVFDNQSVVPPPFNLIPSMHRVALLFRWCVARCGVKYGDEPWRLKWDARRCWYWESGIADSEHKADQERYEKLMVQLIRRYLHCKEMQVKSPVQPLTDEFKEQLKEEITEELLRRSSKCPNKRFTRKPTSIRRIPAPCMQKDWERNRRFKEISMFSTYRLICLLLSATGIACYSNHVNSSSEISPSPSKGITVVEYDSPTDVQVSKNRQNGFAIGGPVAASLAFVGLNLAFISLLVPFVVSAVTIGERRNYNENERQDVLQDLWKNLMSLHGKELLEMDYLARMTSKSFSQEDQETKKKISRFNHKFIKSLKPPKGKFNVST
ncbi:hypothetical protein JTE90_004497 [Oedothorax gibbosus]|uniref:Transient receptor ion channel domain-containing protein n=1 Tax=Oedothorax gibbosus TaxID=931172 RepID=A0AAV6U4L2_9ARAC|nr:hypothetical protein JTE90_004497 [Oedothorax gibbosus]